MSVTVVEPKKRKRLSLEDVLSVETVVPLNDDEELLIRPLTLTEMLNLFMLFQEPFLNLYEQYYANGGVKNMNLAAMIMAAPEFAARIIALASSPTIPTDEEADRLSKQVYARMSGTVQLIALKAIWEVSVPDPKKLGELLSEVTARLRTLQDEADRKREQQHPPTPVQKVSPEVSPTASNSSSPTVIDSTT